MLPFFFIAFYRVLVGLVTRELLVPKARITAAWIANHRTPGLYWDDRHHGLGVRIGKSSAKSWIFQKSGGRRVTLGAWPDLSLENARLEAARLNLSRPGGTVSDVTLAAALDSKLARLKADRKSPVYANYLAGQIRAHAGTLMDRPLHKITAREIGTLHQQLGEAGKPIAANRLLQALRSIHNHARSISDHLGPWPGQRIKPFGEDSRFDRREEPALITDLVAWHEEVERVRLSSPIVADWHLFVLFTGLRDMDAKRASWAMLSGDILRIPEPKGGKAKSFDLPLSRQALEIIRCQPQINEWIFPGRDDHLKNARRATLPGPHTLRRTWATTAERCGCPDTIIRALLNHSRARTVTARYTRSDSDIAVLKQWAQRVADKLSASISMPDCQPE